MDNDRISLETGPCSGVEASLEATLAEFQPPRLMFEPPSGYTPRDGWITYPRKMRRGRKAQGMATAITKPRSLDPCSERHIVRMPTEYDPLCCLKPLVAASALRFVYHMLQGQPWSEALSSIFLLCYRVHSQDLC